MKKYILLLLIIIVFIGCEKDPVLPDSPTLYVTVTNIESDNVTFLVNITNDDPLYNWGIIYGKDASSMTSEDENTSYTSDLTVTDLIENTMYYYKPFVEDKYGNRIYGNVDTFTTNIGTIVTTGSATNDGYSSKYHFTLYASISSLSDVSEFGLMVSSVSSFSSYDTGTYTLSYLTEGTSKAMYWTTTSSGTRYYKAYARLNSGSYIYGEVKSIYVY